MSKPHGLIGKVNNPNGKPKGPEMESLHLRVPKGTRDRWRSKIEAFMRMNPLKD
jgi:hypothetical protein